MEVVVSFGMFSVIHSEPPATNSLVFIVIEIEKGASVNEGGHPEPVSIPQACVGVNGKPCVHDCHFAHEGYCAIGEIEPPCLNDFIED